MAIITQKRILNLIPKTSAPVTIHVSQGNVGETIEFTLVKGDELFTATSDLTATVHGVRSDGANFGPYTCTLNGSKVSFTLKSAMAAISGAAVAEIVLVNANNRRVGSSNFAILVEDSAFPVGVTYSNDTSVYESILTYVQGAVTSMNTDLMDEISARTNADSALNTRIDEIIAPSGGAPSAAEVTDARIGENGITYASLGKAIRTQVGDLKSAISDCLGIYIDGESIIKPNYLNKNSSGGKPTTDSNTRLISEKIYMPPQTSGFAIRNITGTSFIVYRFDASDTLLETVYGTSTGVVFDNCDHVRVYAQYSNNDPITPADGLIIGTLKFLYSSKTNGYVTPEMFPTLDIEDAIEAAISTGHNVKATAESYTLTRTVKISGCQNQIIDFSNADIIYSGSDYAFELTDISNFEFLFKSIKASDGGCFRLIGADSKYCQYINFEGLYINAKTNAFYATASDGTWVNEIRCKMFRVSGNPENAFLLDGQTYGGNVNTWRFFNIGFEGVVNGITLRKSGYHVIESCRYDENITKLLATYYNGCKGINIFGSYKLNTNLFTLNDDTEVIVNSPITFDGTNQTHYYGIYRNNKWGFDSLFTDMLPGTNNFNEILMTGKYRIDTSDAYHAPSLIPYGYLVVQNLLSLDTCTQIYVSTYITDDYPYAMAIRTKPNNNFQSWKYIRAEVLSDL